MRVALLLIVWLVAAPVSADALWCHPREVSARILASHNPNDIHPDWSGESRVGLGWAFSPVQRVEADGIVYIRGDLYSPRGGLIDPGVYVIASEWDCSS